MGVDIDRIDPCHSDVNPRCQEAGNKANDAGFKKAIPTVHVSRFSGGERNHRDRCRLLAASSGQWTAIHRFADQRLFR